MPKVGVAPTGTGTVLLVEDEVSVRRLARTILEMSGYTVREAANGVEALRVASQHPEEIDLLVSDLLMPHLNGQELAQELTALHPELKVLFISGYAQETLSRLPDLPAGYAFLPKPFTPTALTRTVYDLLHA
jgi:CheY-like chemotaxis protein